MVGRGGAEGPSGGSGVPGSDEGPRGERVEASLSGRKRSVGEEAKAGCHDDSKALSESGHFLILKTCRHLQKSWTCFLELLTDATALAQTPRDLPGRSGHRHRASLCLSQSGISDQLQRLPAPEPPGTGPTLWVGL